MMVYIYISIQMIIKGAQMETLLTTRETAKFLRVQLGTLYRWRKENTGPVFLRSGNKVLYSVNELNNWIGNKEINND